jgi:alkylation response protein AidB-like acyl-CoA dehydrogenase
MPPTESDADFRQRARVWLSENLPTPLTPDEDGSVSEDALAEWRLGWDKALFAGGWAGISWPEEYGGQGRSRQQKAIFLEECARVGAPEGLGLVGRNVVGPTLISHGSDSQKQRYIRPLLAGQEIWCLGLSEPDAGSDLASVRCRARPAPDGGWLISGQKVWTSFAQFADRCLLLARTGDTESRHRGLTLFLVDMRSPGVTVRPLRQLTGASEFNEVFFDDVSVAPEDVVGEENRGWWLLQTSLGMERGPEEGLQRQMLYRRLFDEMLEWCDREEVDGTRVTDDPLARQKLGQCLIDLEVMRLDCRRGLELLSDGQDISSKASLTKLFWSHMIQQNTDIFMDLLGPRSLLAAGDRDAVNEGTFLQEFLWSRAATIYSGTSQIQRNIIAERLLGLPRG